VEQHLEEAVHVASSTLVVQAMVVVGVVFGHDLVGDGFEEIYVLGHLGGVGDWQ